MSFDPSKRARFGVSKVRTGCSECKAAHLKCDEALPRCSRCVKGRRECRRQNHRGRALNMVHYVPTVPQSISKWSSLDRREQQLFHTFRKHVGPELAGVHNPEFWLRYTIHIASSEPAVKYAILGLTALYEHFRIGKPNALSDNDTSYPLRQYTIAIGHLTQSIRDSSTAFPDTPLIACILFCAFETMSYHLNSAISHARSGIKMYIEKQRYNKSDNPDAIPAFVLNAIFTRLDTQGLELGETSLVPQNRLQDSSVDDPVRLRNTHKAQETFDELTNAILHAIHDVDLEAAHSAHDYNEHTSAIIALQGVVRRFHLWSKAFDSLVLEDATGVNLAPLILLQIWRILILINLKVDLRTGEMDFDRFEMEFEAIVNLSIAFLRAVRISALAVESKNCMDLDLPLHQLHEIQHSKMNSHSVRGGYLGIHPQCTPFVSGEEFDPQAMNRTTQHLLRLSDLHLNELVKPRIAPVLATAIEPSYCFSPGIVSPLYVTISRCRDPSIRRRALVLMRSCKRREGLWDSELAARLGERVIQIEENRARELNGAIFEASAAFYGTGKAGSASQIPNEARVRMIRPTFLPGRKSIERYYLGWPLENTGTSEAEEIWFEEILEW